MYGLVVDHCAMLSHSRIVLFGLLLALGIELVTICARFGLGLQATRDTSFIATLTFGLRIHHGYIGIALLTAAWVCVGNTGLRNALCMIGLGLVVSDLVHHLLVLWPITGSPEFDLFYNDPSRGS